jgi:hypothetical protein
MPRRRKSRQDIVKAKTGDSRGGGMQYEPPSARLGLVKNGKEEEKEDPLAETLLRAFVFEAIRCR